MALQNPNDLPHDENGKVLHPPAPPLKLKDGEKVNPHPLHDNREDGLIATLANQGVDVSKIKTGHDIDAELNPRPKDPPPVKVPAESKADKPKAAPKAAKGAKAAPKVA